MLVNPEELEKSYTENKENVSEALRKRREAEKYRNFKQLVNAFYGKEESLQEESIKLEDTANIKIEPKIIYNSFYKTLKVEFKIGDKQLYKLKDLPEFYERMLKKEEYRYGAKLSFVHDEQNFSEESIPLLKFILKYSEIIKYANEAINPYGDGLASKRISDRIENELLLYENEINEFKS